MRILKTGGAPEIVASGQSTPDGLAIDETGVYWTNYENFTAGSVNRLVHGSATVETLVDGLSGPRAAALNSTHVYWVAPFYGMILRVTKNGGDVELIHSGQGNVVDIVATEGYHLLEYLGKQQCGWRFCLGVGGRPYRDHCYRTKWCLPFGSGRKYPLLVWV